MKVLVLSHTGDILGGAEMSMLDVFDVLSIKYGVEPEFIVREPVRGMAGELKKRGWKFTSLPYTFWSDSNPPTTKDSIARNARMNLAAVKKVEEIMIDTKPDIVITNSIVCPWAAVAAYNQKKPHVWFIREYGDVDHGRIFSITREKIMADINETTDLVITISEALKKHLDKYIPANKVKVLYNPFKTDEIKSKSLKKVVNPFKDPRSLKLVISGNIAPTKGQLQAIQAVGSLTQKGLNVELCVIGRHGEPKFMYEIQQVIDRYNIQDKIHMLGFKSDLLAYAKFADVGIMASRMEGFGRVTFEYLLLGKPVVGANSGATPELIKNGICGYLYNLESPESLESAIENYLNNKAILKIHSKAAKKRAKEIVYGKYSIDKIYKNIESVPANRRNRAVNKDLNIMKKLNEDQKISQRTSVRLKGYVRHQAKRVYHKSRTLKSRIAGK